ncbi:MAG: hypothetical protein V2I33_13975 [Kangiellaceae bacterium]|jgi:hypothetical protein|nr:hypothetical protein [Kangiellaceae bacterium]
MKNNHMIRLGIVAALVTMIVACANMSALDITRALFGYIEPPKAESMMDTLTREYNLCMKVDPSRDCIQVAYDITRSEQGLDPKALPTGYVTVVRERIEQQSKQQDSSQTSESENDQTDGKQSQDDSDN